MPATMSKLHEAVRIGALPSPVVARRAGATKHAVAPQHKYGTEPVFAIGRFFGIRFKPSNGPLVGFQLVPRRRPRGGRFRTESAGCAAGKQGFMPYSDTSSTNEGYRNMPASVTAWGGTDTPFCPPV